MNLTPADAQYAQDISLAVSALREELEVVQAIIRSADPEDAIWRARLTHHVDSAAAIARDSATLHTNNPSLSTLNQAFRSAMEGYLVFCEQLARVFAGGHMEEIGKAEELQNEANYYISIVSDCLRDIARQLPPN